MLISFFLLQGPTFHLLFRQPLRTQVAPFFREHSSLTRIGAKLESTKKDHDHDHHTMLHRHHDVDDGVQCEEHEQQARGPPESRESCPTRLNCAPAIPLGFKLGPKLQAVGFCWVYHSFLISEYVSDGDRGRVEAS